MKKILIFFFLSSIIFAAKKNEVSHMTFADSQDKNFVVKLKNAAELNSYETKSHGIIKVGDKLIVGEPTEVEKKQKGGGKSFASQFLNFKDQLSDLKEQLGQEGDTDSTCFANIVTGTFAGVVTLGPMYLEGEFRGEEVYVESITAYKTGFGKKSPRSVRIFVKNETGEIEAVSGRTILDLEKALEIGEIIISNTIEE